MALTKPDDSLDLRHQSGAEVRRRVRSGEWTSPTPGIALGYVQRDFVAPSTVISVEVGDSRASAVVTSHPLT